jgi:hypothetical protein
MALEMKIEDTTPAGSNLVLDFFYKYVNPMRSYAMFLSHRDYIFIKCLTW